jgi:hypothetical protein
MKQLSPFSAKPTRRRTRISQAKGTLIRKQQDWFRAMSNNLNPTTDPGQPMVYQIRIKGHLGPQWTDWFEGMTITPEDNGDTLVTGPVIDQAALHGVLKRVRDLNLPLLSIMEVRSRREDTPDAR